MLSMPYRQKVLKFLIKYFLDIRRTIFTLLMVVISLYALLCTVYSDVIVQNENDFLILPWKSLIEKEPETTFAELVGKEREEKCLYVFVLDISGSMRKNTLDESEYINYKKAIQMVDNTFAQNILKLENRKMTDKSDIARVRLYELLLSLLDKNRGGSDSEFAVWTLGDEGIKIYPEEGKAKVQYLTIRDAIKRISNTKGYWQRNTNFANLFNSLRIVYDEELSKYPLSESYERPMVVLTILSDFIDDVRYTAHSKEIENKWNELKKTIQEITNSKIMFNLIEFSEKEIESRRSIFPILKQNLNWIQWNEYHLGEERDNSFLYRVGIAKNTIKLYYKNPNFIPKSRFTIKYTGNEVNTIKIDILSQDNNNTAQKISLLCEKLGFKDDPIFANNQIISGGREFKVRLGASEQIRLTFSDRLPSGLSSPILRISMGNEGRTYQVPIHFIKKLPEWVPVLFLILQIFFVAMLSLILAEFIFFLSSRSKIKGPKNGKN